jgi:site-specific DNA-methyltransferase (adenine-specific)
MTYTLHTGDCRDVMATLPAESVDAIVCDPPYGLSFMGKGWDHGVPGVDFWVEALRVLKPGGHLIAFGGTRTYHRLAVAVEDAGFEVRDCLMWLYGSGFPKSHNLHGEWHGWGTALKPAYEPAILARKPLRGTVADNVAQWGTGGLNIDGCRVGDEGGRWPANIILDEEAAAALDEQSGVSVSKATPRNNKKVEDMFLTGKKPTVTQGHSDTGGASRFFYTAKASRSEREAGLDGVEAQRANHHPTVKPIALMRYMIRLVAPHGAVVLDPFMGSGSTGCAAMVEGMQFVGIDITPEYVDIARRRLAWWSCSLDGNAIIKTEEDDT